MKHGSGSGRARWPFALLALGLCAAFGFAQGDKPAPAPTAQAKAPSPSQQKLDAILERYRVALEEWEKLLADVKSADDYKAAMEKHPGNAFLDEIEVVAKEAKGTETAAQAWTQYASIAHRLGNVKQVAAAVAILLDEHITYSGLDVVPEMLGSSRVMKADEAEKALRLMIEKSPDKGVQASAMLTLGMRLMGGKKSTPERAAEGRALFEKLQKDYAGLKTTRGQEYAKVAEGQLFELDHLQIGKTPPDFEVIDENGVKWKLSDYRGKVVVVDFWGDW
jgi:hypothetical protein